MAKFFKADDSCGEFASMLLDPHPAGNLGFLGGAVDPPVAVCDFGSPVVGAADNAFANFPVRGGDVTMAVCAVADELSTNGHFVNAAPAADRTIKVVFEGGGEVAVVCVC